MGSGWETGTSGSWEVASSSFGRWFIIKRRRRNLKNKSFIGVLVGRYTLLGGGRFVVGVKLLLFSCIGCLGCGLSRAALPIRW